MKLKIFSDFILKNIFPDKKQARNFKNMFRNLATPTVINAGTKTNVIPASAEILVDGRILPGQTVKSFLNEVKNLIGPDFKIKVIRAEEPTETDYNNSFFDLLKTSLVKHDAGCIPVPFLIPGFTDAKYYSRLGIKCYGFAPTKLPKDLEFGALFHGSNERVPVDSIGFGVKVLWDVILKGCCLPNAS